MMSNPPHTGTAALGTVTSQKAGKTGNELKGGRLEQMINAELKWEEIGCFGTGERPFSVSRSKIPGGWLLVTGMNDSVAMVFIPDPDHKWDGNSLP